MNKFDCSSRGIEIELSEVDVAPGGLLTYQGEQIILYIKDRNKSEEVNLYYQRKAHGFILQITTFSRHEEKR